MHTPTLASMLIIFSVFVVLVIGVWLLGRTMRWMGRYYSKLQKIGVFLTGTFLLAAVAVIGGLLVSGIWHQQSLALAVPDGVYRVMVHAPSNGDDGDLMDYDLRPVVHGHLMLPDHVVTTKLHLPATFCVANQSLTPCQGENLAAK